MHLVRVLCLLTSTALVAAEDFSPHYAAFEPIEEQGFIFRRQASSSPCPFAYNQCTTLAGGQGSGACCPDNQNCAIDQAGNVACCPSNAVCTGAISGTATGSTTTPTSVTSPYSSVIGGTTTEYVTTTASYQQVTPTVTGFTGGGSTVPNAYYPFIYIPSTYANAADCSAAWTTCQTESTACLSSLAGANGVTVSGVFGGGTTVVGSSYTILSAASSICSSLSASACYGLQVASCNTYGSGASVTPNGAAPTRFPGMVYAAGAGAVVGAMGAIL